MREWRTDRIDLSVVKGNWRWPKAFPIAFVGFGAKRSTTRLNHHWTEDHGASIVDTTRTASTKPRR
jgi:hypothetical protein